MQNFGYRPLTSTPYNKNHGIDGAVLKYIAVVTMFIDHFCYCMHDFLPETVFTGGRLIGRLAFPIFSYLLAEGFRHTRNVRRYGLRLLAAGIISEIPFDLMVSGQPFYPGHQNIMWTLLISLIMLRVLQKVDNSRKKFMPDGLPETLKYMLYGLTRLAVIALACLISWLTKCDYDWQGPLTVAFWQILPFRLYNGRRGRQLQYFFYLFYPVHILFLVLLRTAWNQ